MGHSGSTILDMSLGCHSNIIGMGEVKQLLKASSHSLEFDDNYNEIFCSCGKRTKDCEFWKKGKEILIQNGDLSPEERYLKLLEHIELTYGEDVIVVDSSKVPADYLKRVNNLVIGYG